MPGRIRAGIVSGHGSSWRGGHIPNNWSLRRARVGRVARGSRPKRAVCARDRKCGDEGQEDGGVHGSRLGPFPHAVDGDARPVRERGRIPVIFILSSDARGAQARIRCATRHGTFSSPRSSWRNADSPWESRRGGRLSPEPSASHHAVGAWATSAPCAGRSASSHSRRRAPCDEGQGARAPRASTGSVRASAPGRARALVAPGESSSTGKCGAPHGTRTGA
jgi:hypothetical protein